MILLAGKSHAEGRGQVIGNPETDVVARVGREDFGHVTKHLVAALVAVMVTVCCLEMTAGA